MGVIVRVDLRGLVSWQDGQEKAVRTAAQRAGVDASRAMRAEASRIIREKKAVKVAYMNKAIQEIKPSSRHAFVWGVKAIADDFPVAAFPFRPTGGVRRNKATGRFRTGRRVQGGSGGVMVEINKGAPKLIREAFKAELQSGHVGVFHRDGAKRRMTKGRYAGQMKQPIHELFTTDATTVFRAAIPQVSDKGREVFVQAFKRNMRAATTESREAVGVWLPDHFGG